MTDYSKIADQLYSTDQGKALAPTVPPPPREPVPAAPAPQSKYAAAADQLFGEQDAQLRTSVFGASAANPDVAARARKIAERTGMAPDAVERNMPTAERQVLVEDIDQHTQDTPTLRSAYGTPYFAKVAKDESPLLAGMEKAVRSYMDPQATLKKGLTGGKVALTPEQFSERVQKVKDSNPALDWNTATQLASQGVIFDNREGGMAASQRPEVNAINLLTGAVRRIYEGAKKFDTNLDLIAGDVTGIDRTEAVKKALAASEHRTFLNSPAPEGYAADQIYSGAIGGLVQLPAILATGGALLPVLSGFFASSGADAYTTTKLRGGTGGEAALSGVLQGGLEALTELLPMKFAMKGIGKMGGGEFLSGFIGRELGSEYLNTIAGNAVDTAIANPNKSWGDYLAELPKALMDTTLQVVGTAGVLSLASKGLAVTAMRAQARDFKAAEAQDRAADLANIFNIAAGSNLRGRDATTFGDFVQQAADSTESPLANVHVDATKLDEVLNQAGVTREAFAAMSPTAAAALEDALQSGGAVSIPIGDLVGRMGDTGIEKALLPHLRATEDGMSQEEAVAEQAAAQQMIQQDAERVIQQATDAQEVEESAGRVRSVMFAQLQATGRFAPDVNKAYTTLVGSFYTSLASRLGVTPEQAYEQFPLRVQSVSQGGESLQQGSPIGDALQAKIDADFGAAVEEYNRLPEANGGQVINTDVARELSPEYQADRTRSADVHEAASAFAKRLYAEKLSRPTPEGKLPTVLFTGGGTGAGKSTGLNLLAESSEAEIVYDTNMNSEASAVTKIEQALDAGRNVHIMYVYRDPVEALTAGALPRAMRMGRTVPVESHAATHAGARVVAEKIAARYANDPRVVITVVDNSRGRGKAAVTTLDKLPQVVELGLKEKLNEATKAEYAAGRISEAVARGTIGESPGTFQAGSRSVRAEPEQADSAPPAQLSDFTPENLPDLLGKSDWAVLTAADPGATKQSDEQNEAAMTALRRDLDEIGLTYTEAVGKYGDTQPSLIITGIPEQVAQALGNKYGQESILTRKGLIYQDGSITPATGIEVFDTPPTDFYTEVPGTGAFFSVQLDFDTRVQPDGTYAQSGREEGDTRYRDRAIELRSGLKAPARSAVGLMDGSVTVKPLNTNFDISKYFTKTQPLDITTPQGQKAVVDALYADTLLALTDAGSAVGWYDRKVTAALDLIAQLHPEILTDEQSKFGFITMLAITSNSTKVNENFEKAEALYSQWKEAGVWPVDVPDAKAARAMRDGMRKMQELVAQHGWQHVRDFMVGTHPVKDVEAFAGIPVASELAGSEIYGAVFLGSKIGAFFNNLYGNFTPVTMDRWFMRSINRVRGSMLAVPDSFPQLVDKLTEQVTANGTGEFKADAQKVLAELAAFKATKPVGVAATLRALPKTLAYVKERANKYAKGITDSTGRARSFFPRTPENVTAKTMFEALTLDQQTPNGGKERVVLRGIMQMLQKKLADGGIPIEMADLQAVLWYYEKDLFDKLKGKKQPAAQATMFEAQAAEAEDYESAARRVVDGRRGNGLREQGAGAAGPGGLAGRQAGERAVDTRVDTTGDFFAQSDVESTATQVEQRRMRQAVDLSLLQDKGTEVETLQQTAPGMKPGEVAITGVHFSTRPGLSFLNGRYYGTGLKGVEKDRVRNSADKRLAERSYFYIDEGKGVRPEAGVGGNAHEAQLTNLYDINADPLKLIVGGDINATESNVLNAGFDGYYRRDAFNQQGAAVVIGPASHAIAVRAIPNPTTKAPPVAPTPQLYKRALMLDEIERMNINAIKAVAPSATLAAGTFRVMDNEYTAAAAVAKMQGIDLPAAYGQGEGARGTFSPSSLTITLLEDADLSTFLHETGHFMLEAMASVASRVDAPADVRGDMEAVLKWFGVKDLTAWNAMSLKEKTASHEKFAEGFEAYLFEGKAPSVELQTVFRRFRSWLQNVYQSLTAFMRTHNTQLSDEVRSVFDRLLASEEAIAQAEDVAGMLPSEDATATAVERLTARSLRDLKWTINARSKAIKVLQKQAAELRAAVKAEVTAEVNDMPVFIARDALAALKHDAKAHGVDTVAQEEAIAAANGFTGVDHMLQDVMAAGGKAATIEEMTNQRMLEQYGDLVDQKAIELAANEEVHNEARAKSLASELAAQQEALGAREGTGKTDKAGRQTTVSILMRAAKHFASNIIGRTTVRNLPARNRQHLAAERRAGQAWLKATAAGATEDAIRAKKDQMLNNAASREAIAAQAEVAKHIEYFNKFNKNSVRASLPTDYLDQIDRLLESLDLRKSTSGKDIDKRQSLRDWVAAQNALGIDPVLPDYILNGLGKTSYKELTVDEVRGLRDTIKNIEHLARLKSKLLKAKDQRDFDAIADELAQSIRDNGGAELPVRLEPDGKVAQFFKGAWVDHRKLNSLIHQMDGGKDNGPFYRALVRSMNESGAQESVMLEKATLALADIFAPVEALPGGLSGGNVFVSEIKNTLSRAGRLSIALNTGNAQNLQRIMGGDGWTQAQVDAIMRTLSRTELEFVNKVWEHVDNYWPEIKAKQLRVSGVVEDKVEAEPFDLTMPDGGVVRMRGGYYPIKYDSDRSIRAEKNEAVEKASEIMRGAVMRPTTRRGHTKARVEEVNGRPLRKDLAGLTQHISQVVHDLAWHEWFIDANRLLNDSRIHGAIRDHYGAQTARAMRDAINAIAVGDAVHQGQIDQLLLRMRAAVTRSIMGVSVTTAFLQPFGLTQSMARIGVMPVLKGAARWAGDAVHMESTVGWVAGKSDFMRRRSTTFNRELREINQRLQGKSKFARIADAALFMAMQKMQLVADIPTWVGMYEKALAGGVSEDTAIALADEAVLASQGGGTTKDLSAVQRNMPFLTQFYSYFNTTMNLVAEKTALTDFKNPRAVAGWLSDMALLTVIPSILPALITFAMKGGGDDDDTVGTWAKRALDWYASYMFGMFVGLRELPTLWSPFDYGGPPAAKLLNDGKRLVQQSEQGEIDDGLVLAAIGFLGTGLGLPTTQLVRSYKGWLAWSEGDAPGTSILFGPPPKD